MKGHLDPCWSEWFGGLQVTNEPNGEALLSGYIPDQAALHGVLAKVRPSTYRRHAARATARMPSCVAKQVTHPIRNREK